MAAKRSFPIWHEERDGCWHGAESCVTNPGINVESKSNLSGRGKAVIYTWFGTRFTISEHQQAQPQADELPGVSVLRPVQEKNGLLMGVFGAGHFAVISCLFGNMH